MTKHLIVKTRMNRTVRCRHGRSAWQGGDSCACRRCTRLKRHSAKGRSDPTGILSIQFSNFLFISYLFSYLISCLLYYYLTILTLCGLILTASGCPEDSRSQRKPKLNTIMHALSDSMPFCISTPTRPGAASLVTSRFASALGPSDVSSLGERWTGANYT